MSNNKQSSVEWLISQLTNRQNGVFDGLPYLSVDEIYEQAKAMHKEEIEKSWVGGKNCLSAEHYYNETFGDNNEQQ